MEAVDSRPTSAAQASGRHATLVGLGGVLLATACLGCQTLGPGGGLPGLGGIGEQRKLAELAAQDPFPSPSDVGIEPD